MRLYLDKMAELYKDEIIEYVDHQILHNCNLGGMEYKIIPSDFTYIENCDEIDATFLLHGIFEVIEKEEDINKTGHRIASMFGSLQITSLLQAQDMVRQVYVQHDGTIASDELKKLDKQMSRTINTLGKMFKIKVEA